ncbi:MAG: hypothetical protein JWO00_112 [Candidatus Parcubacteria bacterium]|nr:hypothetical protein [Candidatus Parcubacteria bacterium]
MKYLLATFFTLTAFGIPAVATYYPTQTNAVMSVIGSAGNEAAAVAAWGSLGKNEKDIDANSEADIVPQEQAETSQPSDISEEERNIFPPRPI